ncbi:MAG: VOC family protein [Pyrinomonadaceae bacterium]
MKHTGIILLVLFGVNFALAQTGSKENLLRTYGLKINVDDMKKAVLFYTEKVGFEIEDRSGFPKQVVLKTEGNVKLILNRVKKLNKQTDADARVSFTLQVNDLDQAMTRMKAAGLDFGANEIRREGVGNAIYFNDPFGRKISIMHQTIIKTEPFKEPKIYNFGFYLPEMDAARDFYVKKLGFVERSEKYLPLDMPLGHNDKSFGFMLHYREGVRPFKSEYPKKSPFYAIIFKTADLEKTAGELNRKAVKIVDRKYSNDGKLELIVIEDPFGNISEIID